jgi:hypothetical protein
MLVRARWLLLALLLACGSDAGVGATPEALCDGSSGMRLVYAVSGGFVPVTFNFTNPRGHTFLAIDGSCHYFVSDDYMRGVHTGSLSASDADALAHELRWDELGGWNWSVTQDETCPDAGGQQLTRARKRVGCSCGCDAAAPAGLSDALTAAQRWSERLATAGEALAGPVSGLALERSDAKLDPSVDRALDWPLTTGLAAVPNLLRLQSESDLWKGDGTHARFDPPDATKLRELRSRTLADPRNAPGYVLVRDAGKVYELYVRDELPAAVGSAWDALDATVPGP